MIVYSVLILVTLIFHFYFFKKNEKNKARIRCFVFLEILFTVVSMIRYNVGTDYISTYSNAFMWLKNGLGYKYEFLFLLLNKLIIFLRGDATTLLAVCALFTIPIFFRFIRKNLPEKYWFLGAFIFIGTTIYYATMNVVRQYMAIAVLLFAFDYLKENKYFRYLLLNGVAILFHSSAIINLFFFIIYLLYKYRKINYILIFIYLISLIFIFADIRSIADVFSFMIPDKYLRYLDSDFFLTKNYSAALKLLLPNALYIYMVIKNKALKHLTNYNEVYCGVFMLAIILNAGFGVNVFIRLSWYFDYYYILAIPFIVSYLSVKKKRYSDYVQILTMVYCLFWNVYSIFLQNGHGVIPYSTIFFK